MTRMRAEQVADNQSRATKSTRHVVWDDAYETYTVCTDADLVAHYCGKEPVYTTR